MIDSHTHLYLEDFGHDGGADAVNRAFDAGVNRLMFPNVDLNTIAPMKKLCAGFAGQIDMAMGLHPTEVNESWETDMKTIERELSTGIYRAVGEIGIDLYWDKTFRAQQMQAFVAQCDMAVERQLPVIIHCREGLDEILECLKSMTIKPKGVFHSFTGSVEDVEKIREVGDFHFGINGIVTFKNSKLKDVVPYIGADRLLLETDSPYLAPVPKRGTRNESAYLVYTAACVAEALNLSMRELSDITDSNYQNLFIN